MFYTDWYDVLGSKIINMRAFENLPKSIQTDVNLHANAKNQRRPTPLDIDMMLVSLIDVYMRNKQDEKIASVVKAVLIELGTAIRLNPLYKKAFVENKKSVLAFAALFSLFFDVNANFGFCKELCPTLTKIQVGTEMQKYRKIAKCEKTAYNDDETRDNKMISMKNRELLRVEVISKQSWLIYKLYSESGKFLCYIGQPMGNT